MDDLLNLVVEISGQELADKEAKADTARALWVPAVNAKGAPYSSDCVPGQRPGTSYAAPAGLFQARQTPPLRLARQPASAAGGTACAAIQARQRPQLAGEPGVRLPSSREPPAPVAEGTLAATPSTVSAARIAKAIALRASAGTPAASVRSTGMPPSCCDSSRHSRPLRAPPPLSRTRSGVRPPGSRRQRAVVMPRATKWLAVQSRSCRLPSVCRTCCTAAAANSRPKAWRGAHLGGRRCR